MIFTIFVMLIFIGSASAANSATQSDITAQIKNPDVGTGLNSSQFNIVPSVNINYKKVRTPVTNHINTSGCCSVLLHVKKGHDVFSFRRDSTYAANLYFQRLNWYGKETIKEFKTTNGYFFHTIISRDGWIVSTGGPDISYLNKKLENLAGRTASSGYITSSTVNSAYTVLRTMGMGHFLIKAPNDDVGLVIYNGGSTKRALFKMGNGQYVSVPNHPAYYRNGYVSTTNPVASSIKLATTDRWGVNRRNIITYDVTKYKDLVNYSTLVKIWASTCRGTPDNIIFGGKTIGGYKLPKIPNKKYIGQILLKNHDSIPKGIFGGIILQGVVSQYTSSFSNNGKHLAVTYKYVNSTLHYDVNKNMRTGTWGYGKYTTVLVTGIDNRGRNVHNTIIYYNNLFRESKLLLTTGNYGYKSHATLNGSKIIETVSGRFNKYFTFKGNIIGTIDFINGQKVHKKSLATINYWNNGVYFGKTISSVYPLYKNYGGIYKLIKTVKSSQTYYSNSDLRSSIITKVFTRNTAGNMVGLKTTGTCKGSEHFGTEIRNYTGIIYLKTRIDSHDLYNEKFDTGNYFEERRSTSSNVNKNLPIFETLLY